jgi:GT2 family glycosyltransferase
MRCGVSFIISTYNRRDVLLGTLARLDALSGSHETIVVDNASKDGTAAGVRERFPHVSLISLKNNEGSCAKNRGLWQASGDYVVFLDDDSFPSPDSIPRMIRHFELDASLGAAGFIITLPDGSRECSAYPHVFIGCGVGFRRETLLRCGGLPDDFFMQAEEYDLSLRLLDAGLKVRTFDDLHVTHLKTPQARISARTMRLDVRNNLALISRRFPRRWVLPFARDWMRRYAAIARAKGLQRGYWCGLTEGVWRSAFSRQPVSDVAFESFARIDEIHRKMRELRIRRALFIDYGKNILPYWLAARACGIELVGVSVADPAIARAARHYRGATVLHDQQTAALRFDAAIVSNSSPVHAQLRAQQWRGLTDRPVIDLLNQEESGAGRSRVAA